MQCSFTVFYLLSDVVFLVEKNGDRGGETMCPVRFFFVDQLIFVHRTRCTAVPVNVAGL